MASSTPIYPALSAPLPTHMLILSSLHLNSHPRHYVFMSLVPRSLSNEMHMEFASSKKERAALMRNAEHQNRV